MSIYLKSSGLKAKAFDTIHALYLCMCQKTTYRGVEMIAETAQENMRRDVQQYPFQGSHDNLNVQFRSYEQRLNNKSHFDSGTAATLYVVKNATIPPPNNRAYQLQRELGLRNPITPFTILELDAAASPRIHRQNIHRILRVLLDSPAFDLTTYEHRNSSLFDRPPPVFQLPTGPEHATIQYMFKTVHQEEASYEGNEKCLEEWLRQLSLNSEESLKRMGHETLLVWIGDQLTCSRLRGIKRFRSQDLNAADRLEYLVEAPGWFHEEVNQGFSYHNQYYLKSTSLGLKHAFDLLSRKGLTAPSVQGTFHQNLKDALQHIAEARFRDALCVAGSVSSLTELRSRSPKELVELAEKVVDDFASTQALDHLRRGKRKGERDDVLAQSIQFNRDILIHLELGDAIKTGDVGRMRDILPRQLFRFIGGKHSNYIGEILELIQGLEREWPEDLRNWMLRYCWLANTTGWPGLFEPFDMLQEHNIRDIKV